MIPEQFLLVVIVEGRVPAKEDVRDHTHTPHVHTLAYRAHTHRNIDIDVIDIGVRCIDIGVKCVDVFVSTCGSINIDMIIDVDIDVVEFVVVLYIHAQMHKRINTHTHWTSHGSIVSLHK